MWIFFCFQEGRTVKSTSGFGGKGFKFDETEAQLVSDRKKLQKAALGLEDSDDDDPSMDVRTVKPVLSDHSKIDKTKILMTNDSLMKVESIAECSPWSILQYF